MATRTLDAACAAAVDLARAAAVAEAGAEGLVGEHLGTVAEADRVLVHSFATRDRAYRGWRWSVTVVRAARARAVTINDVVLLPGPDALLAPAWVPWIERVRPGDLGVGDVMVTAADDERLVPAYAAGDDPDLEEVAFTLGLGRVRVLSFEGRSEAAGRWHEGAAGPQAAIAVAAPGRCADCGFYLPLAGALGALFGACANAYAPDDARVVAADHGCGAHSEALVDAYPSSPVPVPVAAELVAEPPAPPDDELGHS